MVTKKEKQSRARSLEALDRVGIEMVTGYARSILKEVSDLREGTMHPAWRVGCGCSAVNLLAPLVVPGCRVAAVVVSPMERLHYLEQHKKLLAAGEKVSSIASGSVLHVLPGTPALHVATLASPNDGDLLEKLAPDLVICAVLRDGVLRKRALQYIALSQVRAIVWEV